MASGLVFVRQRASSGVSPGYPSPSQRRSKPPRTGSFRRDGASWQLTNHDSYCGSDNTKTRLSRSRTARVESPRPGSLLRRVSPRDRQWHFITIRFHCKSRHRLRCVQRTSLADSVPGPKMSYSNESSLQKPASSRHGLIPVRLVTFDIPESAQADGQRSITVSAATAGLT
ncbi:hypothetical protein LX36DRAFT_417190 [Colletotrichum falcatum]|nr:hypothetical protein LX36DRAFT_417190 [Colletotrichum falcatum]